MRKVLFIYFFFLNSVLVLNAQSYINNIEEAKKLYQEGKKALKKGDYKKANEFFKKAERILKEEESEKEKIKFSKETKKKIDKIKLLKEANKAYYENDFDKAMFLYEKLLNSVKENSNLYYNLGVIYLRKGKYKKAIEEFKKATQINPKNADAYYNLGIIYESFLGDRNEAIDYYKKYLRYSHAEDRERVKKWVEYLRRIKE